MPWLKVPRLIPNTPVCAVSRGNIFTGRRTANLGGFWTHGAASATATPGTAAYWDNAVGGSDSGKKMFPYWLQNAGYHTAMVGKYLNVYPFSRGDTYVPFGWNEWRSFKDTSPAIGPAFFDYTLNVNGALITFGATDTWTTTGSDASGRSTSTGTDYSTDRLASMSRRLISGELGGMTEPFYLHYATYAVKQQSTTIGPARRHKRTVTDATTTLASPAISSSTAAFTAADVGKVIGSTNFPVGTTVASVVDASNVTASANATATGVANVTIIFRSAYTDPGRSPSFNEADIADKPEWLREYTPSAFADPGTTTTGWDDERKSKVLTALAIDEAIRDLVTALTARTTTGRSGTWMDRTLIIVTTEHSNAMGHHRQDQKGLPYECCVTTPMYVHLPTGTGARWNVLMVIVDDALISMWDSMPYLSSLPTSTIDALVSTIDITPTILETAGATRHATRAMDGQSFLPLLDGRITASQWRQAAISEWTNSDLFPQVPNWKSVRTPTRRYTEIDALGATSPAETELYLLDTDPDELVNQTANATYAAEKADLAAKLAMLAAS